MRNRWVTSSKPIVSNSVTHEPGRIIGSQWQWSSLSGPTITHQSSSTWANTCPRWTPRIRRLGGRVEMTSRMDAFSTGSSVGLSTLCPPTNAVVPHQTRQKAKRELNRRQQDDDLL